VSGTRDTYFVADLEGQLRKTIVSRMTDVFAPSEISFLDMAANQGALAAKIAEGVRPTFADLGLELASFVVENLSLPDELQKMLDQRIGMGMVADLNRFTQFEAAQSILEAAKNEGGGMASIGAGLGAGTVIGQTMMNAMRTEPPTTPAAPAGAKFCVECGKPLPGPVKFCPECGKPQR
jgi:membrane protease subunit (stomatin/prohibitin family)